MDGLGLGKEMCGQTLDAPGLTHHRIARGDVLLVSDQAASASDLGRRHGIGGRCSGDAGTCTVSWILFSDFS